MAIPAYDQALADSQLAYVLTETATILYRATEPNGAGGQIETFTPGEEIRCAIAPKAGGKFIGRGGGGEKTSSMERIEERTTHVITLPAGTEVNEHDQIEVTGRGKFEVLVLERRSTEVGRQIEAREVL